MDRQDDRGRLNEALRSPCMIYRQTHIVDKYMFRDSILDRDLVYTEPDIWYRNRDGGEHIICIKSKRGAVIVYITPNSLNNM